MADQRTAHVWAYDSHVPEWLCQPEEKDRVNVISMQFVLVDGVELL